MGSLTSCFKPKEEKTKLIDNISIDYDNDITHVRINLDYLDHHYSYYLPD
jgi:hypothetical protein